MRAGKRSSRPLPSARFTLRRMPHSHSGQPVGAMGAPRRSSPTDGCVGGAADHPGDCEFLLDRYRPSGTVRGFHSARVGPVEGSSVTDFAGKSTGYGASVVIAHRGAGLVGGVEIGCKDGGSRQCIQVDFTTAG